MNPLSVGRESASQVSSPGLLPTYNLVHSLLRQTDNYPEDKPPVLATDVVIC